MNIYVDFELDEIPPPSFDRRTDVYSKWKRRLEVWLYATDVDIKKQASMIIFNLDEDTRQAILDVVSSEKYKSEDGVEKVLEVLDQMFIAKVANSSTEMSLSTTSIDNVDNTYSEEHLNKLTDNGDKYEDEINDQLVEKCDTVITIGESSELALSITTSNSYERKQEIFSVSHKKCSTLLPAHISDENQVKFEQKPTALICYKDCGTSMIKDITSEYEKLHANIDKHHGSPVTKSLCNVIVKTEEGLKLPSYDIKRRKRLQVCTIPLEKRYQHGHNDYESNSVLENCQTSSAWKRRKNKSFLPSITKINRKNAKIMLVKVMNKVSYNVDSYSNNNQSQQLATKSIKYLVLNKTFDPTEMKTKERKGKPAKEKTQLIPKHEDKSGSINLLCCYGKFGLELESYPDNASVNQVILSGIVEFEKNLERYSRLNKVELMSAKQEFEISNENETVSLENIHSIQSPYLSMKNPGSSCHELMEVHKCCNLGLVSEVSIFTGIVSNSEECYYISQNIPMSYALKNTSEIAVNENEKSYSSMPNTIEDFNAIFIQIIFNDRNSRDIINCNVYAVSSSEDGGKDSLGLSPLKTCLKAESIEKSVTHKSALPPQHCFPKFGWENEGIKKEIAGHKEFLFSTKVKKSYVIIKEETNTSCKLGDRISYHSLDIGRFGTLHCENRDKEKSKNKCHESSYSKHDDRKHECSKFFQKRKERKKFVDIEYLAPFS